MKKGIMLVNLGTPNSLNLYDIKKYLKNFLSDKRVVSMQRYIWLPLLNGIIIPKRSKHSRNLYKQIWTDNGSPLLIHTINQTNKLSSKMDNYIVDYAMTYSEPYISTVIDKMLKEGVEDILFIPLYPQYSSSTTAAVFDKISIDLMKRVNIPKINFIKSFHSNKLYIKCLANRINIKLQSDSYDTIVFSYHSLPISYIENGDPYDVQCTETTNQVMSLVGDYPYIQSYQSKFGSCKWLLPSTNEIIKLYPKNNIKKVLVITPGFVCDCLETLLEIEDEGRKTFIENGGVKFDYIHPFNDSDDFIEVLENIILEN